MKPTPLFDHALDCLESEARHLTALLGVLDDESEVLRSGRTDSLWELSRQKQELAAEVSGAREKLIRRLGREGIPGRDREGRPDLRLMLVHFKGEERRGLEQCITDLARKRESLKDAARQNLRHVETCLSTVENLVGNMVKAAESGTGYGYGKNAASRGSLFVSRRV